MGVEKSEIKKAAAAAFVSELEAARAAADLRVQRFDGAAEALKKSRQAVEGLLLNVEKDFKAETLGVPTTAVETAKLIQRWILRASGVLANLADSATIEGLRAEGEVAGLAKAVAAAQKSHDAEHAKIESLRSQESAPGLRPEGVHPGPSIADQRRESSGPKKRVRIKKA